MAHTQLVCGTWEVLTSLNTYVTLTWSINLHHIGVGSRIDVLCLSQMLHSKVKSLQEPLVDIVFCVDVMMIH